jgi:3-hydroxybutyryl-CoA dehydrogenase
MGAGIAAVAAQSGADVALVESDPAAQQKAREGAGAHVQFYDTIPTGLDVEIAIEAVTERLDVKREVFAALAKALGPQALLATNTSSLSVSEIADGIDRPERVLGLHFFNPPGVMKLVEIVRGDETSDDAVAQARAIADRFGKTSVVAADTPGFIVNRVARPYYLQALRAYDAGVATIEELDQLARGAGFRMGPFELMDLIGLDVNLATSESIYERTEAKRLEPVALQRELVRAGKLGRKSGAGFYNYSNGKPPHDDSPPEPPREAHQDERVLVVGLSNAAIEMREALDKAYAHVNVCENAEAVEEMPLDSTVVVDGGDGVSDRSSFIAELDALFVPETVILVDAYATNLIPLAKRLRHPERVVGFGLLGSLARQSAIEIVDAEETSDDALELAQELFESIGKRVVLVGNSPGLFLGRTIGSIVNEAVCVVQEDVATPDDVDLAMRLGTNYPLGPIAWGQEIGGDRVARILQQLAGAEGAAFAPHRALWVLDVESEQDPMDVAVSEGVVESKPGSGIVGYPGIFG